MEKQRSDFVTIGEILNKFRRHKWSLIVCIFLSLLLAATYNYLASPVYQATAMVSFERFSKDNMLDMEFANSKYESEFIANRIKEIKTWTFAQEIFESMPDSLRSELSFSEAEADSALFTRYVINDIQDNLSVAQVEGTPSILTISFDSRSAELAQAVSNTAVDVLRRNNLGYRRNEFANLREFIDGQIKVVEGKLEAAEEALSKFKSDDNITSLEDESREILRRITQAEILNNEVQTKRKAREKKLSTIKEKIAEQRSDMQNVGTESTSPTITKLKEQLVDLEVQSTNLQVQGYAENHPMRQQIDQEIKQIRQTLLDLTMALIEDQNINNLVDPLSLLKDYLQESVAIEMEIEALKAQQTQLKETLQTYNQRLNRLSQNDSKLYGLARDREVNNAHYVQLLKEREQARLREAAEIGTMRVIEQAQLPLTPDSPRKELNLFIGLLAGITFGCLLVFIRLFNDLPQSQEEVEMILGLPILSTIPTVNAKSTVSFNGVDGRFVPLYRDAFVYLWHRIQSLNRGKINSVMIASATPGEGKSTVATNLAITAAKLGQRTLLIDGDLRKPALAKLLNVPESPGLSDFVSVQTELDDMPPEGSKFLSGWLLLREALNGNLPIENLKFLGPGPVNKEPSLIWNSLQLKEILATLIQDFDFVVIDSPPVIGIPDAVSIASCVDGIVLCVESESVDRTLLMRTRKTLKQTNRHLIGVVWNKVEPRSIYGKHEYRKYYQAG